MRAWKIAGIVAAALLLVVVVVLANLQWFRGPIERALEHAERSGGGAALTLGLRVGGLLGAPAEHDEDGQQAVQRREAAAVKSGSDMAGST